jgi:hypothetical protein
MAMMYGAPLMVIAFCAYSNDVAMGLTKCDSSARAELSLV